MPQARTLTGQPGPYFQDVIANDLNPAPPVMKMEAPALDLGSEDVSIDRYTSKAWHDREVEKVWRKTWQMACRVEEIPDPGDHIVYDIVDDSLIVTRTQTGEIKAFFNACLHRGTQLRKEGGCIKHIRCPFHAWTWDLEGRLIDVPASWDFPHIDRDALALPQAKVGVWAGFVFINMDPDCEPLESYLEILPDHFEAFALEDRYKAVHVAKIMPCNWKLALEAFSETYHVFNVHAQVLSYNDDENTQYDVWPGVRHVNRMISVQGIPSPSRRNVPPETTIAHIRRDAPFFGGKPIELEEGDTARTALAKRAREKFSRAAGRDMSGVSDTESLDLIEYMLFPNLSPWGGYSLPLCYRFRPYGDDPDRSIMEIMFLFAKRPDGSHPEPAPIHWLGPDEPWSAAEEMGSAALLADQDTDNLMRIQRGLKTTRKPGVTLARYQESRIRHFHQTLDAYMAK
jgi:phenylpropionate dioxygenase-like ring-hydroxylating dioxygenase large terminal subunit